MDARPWQIATRDTGGGDGVGAGIRPGQVPGGESNPYGPGLIAQPAQPQGVPAGVAPSGRVPSGVAPANRGGFHPFALNGPGYGGPLDASGVPWAGGGGGGMAATPVSFATVPGRVTSAWPPTPTGWQPTYRDATKAYFNDPGVQRWGSAPGGWPAGPMGTPMPNVQQRAVSWTPVQRPAAQQRVSFAVADTPYAQWAADQLKTWGQPASGNIAMPQIMPQRVRPNVWANMLPSEQAQAQGLAEAQGWYAPDWLAEMQRSWPTGNATGNTFWR
jgi:hypothetical protein